MYFARKQLLRNAGFDIDEVSICARAGRKSMLAESNGSANDWCVQW